MRWWPPANRCASWTTWTGWPIPAASYRPTCTRDAQVQIGDLRDRGAVDRALDGVDRVFHLGGVVGNGESMINVRNAVDVNCVGTATLIEALIERREVVRRLVVASSMVVYGDGAYRCPEHGDAAVPSRPADRLRLRQWEPVCAACGREIEPVATTEGHPLRPSSVYGISKRDQEELALVLGRAYGIETVALRYLNVYGPRQALGNPYTGVAAIFAARVLSGKAPLVFEDGAQIRDLVHVSDVVAATRAAMEVPAAAGRCSTSPPVAACASASWPAGSPPPWARSWRPRSPASSAPATSATASPTPHWPPRCWGSPPGVPLDHGIPELAAWVAQQAPVDASEDALADLRRRGLVG